MQTNNEIWKSVLGYEGLYEVSNIGNIRSLNRVVMKADKTIKNLKGKEITKYNVNGYYAVSLLSLNKNMLFKVHRLVANAFIPNPNNKPIINHINGIKNDNRVENLEWSTTSENRQHAYNTGLQNSTHCQGEKNFQCKLTQYQVKEIRRLHNKKEGFNYNKLGKMFNVSSALVRLIVIRKLWKHI